MALESQKEEQQLKNRIKDLADKSFKQNIYTFSGFLGLSEQDVFWKSESELRYVSYKLWGGTDTSERKVLRFGSMDDLGYEEEYPIVCVCIQPTSPKFAEKLSHRDYLGALMNLGIERSTLGDIKTADKDAYLFCLDSIAEYICTNLDKVRHTTVKCSVITEFFDLPEDVPEAREVLLPSLRLDVCLAKVYNQSRNDILEHFRAGKVYVNGRLCENNSKTLKEGDVINLRGCGKFIYTGVKYETKKGKICAEVQVYG